MIKTYTFDDVVNTLNQVAAYDWRGFWTERLTNHGPGAPLGGIEGSGWKLVYDENHVGDGSRRGKSMIGHQSTDRIRLACRFAKMEALPIPSKDAGRHQLVSGRE